MISIKVTATHNKKVTTDLLTKLDVGLDDLADFIHARATELVSVDEGMLKKSLHVERDFLSKSIIADAPHAPYIEYGTRPHWPPIEPLAAWAIRVLQVPKAEAQQVGFLIARKIAAVGTEPSPFLRPS
ncbi:MAG: hypothetical protein Q8M92_07825, partial [Candidatus Subteraquimicrobiales bacterium]|nr:hypothetical protein [Candidatus Subteraquimicrobiales bacterium]